jgi:probable phosphoglycerate mutase
MPARFVIQADGGSRGNPGPAAYGVVVRDSATGDVLAERGEYLGTATNNVAEYRGLIAGLQIVRELDPDAAVDVYLDSRLVVEQMRGTWRIKHPDLIPLARRAHDLLPSGGATFSWVPRERNREADRLVNEALDAAENGRAHPHRPVPGPAAAGPAVPPEVAARRQQLLEEEVARLRTAVDAQDLPAIARHLAAVAQVAAGTAATYGIDLDAGAAPGRPSGARGRHADDGG